MTVKNESMTCKTELYKYTPTVLITKKTAAPEDRKRLLASHDFELKR